MDIIKLDGVIDVEDCEKVSRKIENKIDKLMKEDKEYILEISSAGLEKQLKSIKLYKKYTGLLINIKLYKNTEILKDVKLKEFEAKLMSVNEEENKITVKKNISNIDITFTLDLKDIASAHTVFDYDNFFKENKN